MSMHSSLRIDKGHTSNAASTGQARSAARKRACQRAAKLRIQAAADAAGLTVARYLQVCAQAYTSKREIINPANIVYEQYGYRPPSYSDSGWHSTASRGTSRLGRPGSRLWDD